MFEIRYQCYGRILRRLLSSLVFVWCAVCAPAQACDLSTPLEFTKVGPGAYVHQGVHEDMDARNCGDIANIGFIVGDKSVAIIDPGGSPAVGRQLLNAVADTTPLPISHVVVTHFHPDHFFGGFQAEDDVIVVAHNNYSRALLQRGQFYLERNKALFSSNDTMELIKPTVVIEQQEIINLGNRTLQLTAHQTAHTDNDLSVFDVDSRILWAGDLLFHQRIPSLDGSVSGWLAVMDELAALKPALVIPGHGPVGQWENIAPKQRHYLEVLRNELRDLISINGRLAEAVNTVGVSERTKWVLFEEMHQGNVTRAFKELEWE